MFISKNKLSSKLEFELYVAVKKSDCKLHSTKV
jgi:hypothetical protein